jgi:hypothetical protein
MYEATATAAASGPSVEPSLFSSMRSSDAVMRLERPKNELPVEAAVTPLRGGGAGCSHRGQRTCQRRLVEPTMGLTGTLVVIWDGVRTCTEGYLVPSSAAADVHASSSTSMQFAMTRLSAGQRADGRNAAVHACATSSPGTNDRPACWQVARWCVPGWGCQSEGPRRHLHSPHSGPAADLRSCVAAPAYTQQPRPAQRVSSFRTHVNTVADLLPNPLRSAHNCAGAPASAAT